MNIISAVFSLLALVLAGCSMLPPKEIDIEKYESVEQLISSEFSSLSEISLDGASHGRVSPYSIDHSISIYNNLKKYCETKHAGTYKRILGPTRGGIHDANDIHRRVGLFSCETSESPAWHVYIDTIVRTITYESGDVHKKLTFRPKQISDAEYKRRYDLAIEKSRQGALKKAELQRQRELKEKKNLIALQHMADFGYGTYLCYEENLGEKRTRARFRRVLDNGWLEVVVLKKIIGFNTELPYSVGKTELISDPRGWGLCPTR